MKKAFITLTVLLFTTFLQAQGTKTVHLTQAGSLTDSLTAQEKSDITKLIITGNINARDFKTMRDSTIVQDIDLSGATIVAYSGTLGTSSSNSTDYAENEVPANAFYVNGSDGAMQLDTVILPQSVTAIGDVAFYFCGLKYINMPASLIKIGSDVFEGATFTSLVLPPTVTYIRDYAFAGCGQLKSINIPPSVTYLGDGAFQQCSSLTSIAIPPLITSISTNLFAWCSNLSSITIPTTITSIGQEAFNSCQALTSVNIPASIKSIGYFAFGNCITLASVTIPSSVTSIGGYAFAGDSLLNNIYTYAATPVDISSSDAVFYEVKTASCTLHIPYNSLSLYTAAGKWQDFTSIVESIDSVHQSSPGTLSSLLNVNERSSITALTITGTIDARDFKTMRDSLPLLAGIDLSGATIVEYAGKQGTVDDSIDYRANEIPQRALYGKGSITSFIFPQSITSIGSYAFAYCSGLTGSLNIPSSVTFIGNNAFAYCSSLKGSLTFPSSITSIEPATFASCSGLTGSLTIPSSITSIGQEAFSGCNGFTSLSIPSSVTSIGASAFNNCTGFTGSLTIPSSVTSIGNYAFGFCSGFTGSLIIPSSIDSIDSGVFNGCIGFTDSLSIPSSVTYIGDEAFLGCTGFTGSIGIPSSVTTIGNFAFSGCIGFTDSLIIPSSVTYIGLETFDHCSGLQSIYSYLKTPLDLTNSQYVFNKVDTANCILHVPYGTKILYQAANQWKDFTHIVEMAEILVSSVSLDTTQLTMLVGSIDILKTTVLPLNADNRTIEWKSDNSSVVSVDANGQITANAVGFATVTCTSLRDASLKASIVINTKQFLFSASQINIANGSDTDSVFVNSNSLWKASCNQTWLTISPGSSDKNSGYITMTATANKSTSKRVAIITVSARESKLASSIYVTQAPGDTIIYIYSPKQGSYLNVDSLATFTVQVKDPIVPIDSVAFFIDGTKLFVDNSTPYSFDWKVEGSASTDVKAIAYFNGDSAIDMSWFYVNAAPFITPIPEQTAGTDKRFANIDLTAYVKDDFTAFAKLQTSVDKNDYFKFSIIDGMLVAIQTDSSWTGTTQATLSVTDDEGVTSKIAIPFTQLYLLKPQEKNPTASFIADKIFVATGSSIRFYTTFSSTDTAIWNFGGGTQTEGTYVNPTVSFDTAGVYTISVTAKNATGEIVSIKKNYIIVSELNIPDSTICKGDSVTIAVLGSGFNSYQWNTGQTSSSITVAPSLTTTYKVLMKKGLTTITNSVTITIPKQPELGNDTTFCEGGSLKVTPGVFAKYYWNGSTSEGLAYYEATKEEKITVKTIDELGCIAKDSVTIGTLYARPVVSIGKDSTFCWKKNISLDAGNAGASYVWNTGATSQTIAADTTQTYSVTVTDKNNCSNSGSIAINVIVPIVPQIGIVTMSQSGKNLVAWEPINNKGIKLYHVWKENTSSVFEIVKTINKGDSTVFIDQASNPQSVSNRYALTTVDLACNNESALSPIHGSMHLSCVLQSDGIINASWNNYEGLSVSKYIISRAVKGQPLQPYAVKSEDQGLKTVYIDSNAIGLNSWYQVSFELTRAIALSALKSDSGPFSQSLSNMAESELTAESIESIDRITMSPNPAKEFVIFTHSSRGSFVVEVFDVLGHVVAKQTAIGTMKLSCSNFNPGVYFVKIVSDKTVTAKTLKVE